jgi:hypothetical protein
MSSQHHRPRPSLLLPAALAFLALGLVPEARAQGKKLALLVGVRAGAH